jgi:hypothetical protein
VLSVEGEDPRVFAVSDFELTEKTAPLLPRQTAASGIKTPKS